MKPAWLSDVLERDQTVFDVFRYPDVSAPAPGKLNAEAAAEGPDMCAMGVLTAALIAFAVATVSGHAQEIGQPGHGLALAERLCAQCHEVSGRGDKSPKPDAPTFRDIASTPGMTSIALTAALQTSHATMPNVMLTAEERTDVIAYILSLK
jgi:mono/diheme cytochrome c family protein